MRVFANNTRVKRIIMIIVIVKSSERFNAVFLAYEIAIPFWLPFEFRRPWSHVGI